MQSRARLTCLAAVIGAASPLVRAEPIAYFDVGGLIVQALLWLLALVFIGVLAGVAARKRRTKSSSAFLAAFIMVLVAPFVIFANSTSKQESETAMALRNADAEAKFCTVEESTPIKMTGSSPIAISIRVVEPASSFPYRSSRNPDAVSPLNAAAAVDILKDNWQICFRTRVRSAEIDSSGAKIGLCKAEAVPSGPAPSATEPMTTYDVTIGEVWEESTYPAPEVWGETRMARISIRVSDGTGRTLAMNSSSILLSGKHGRAHSCRHFVRELPEVLAAVFPI